MVWRAGEWGAICICSISQIYFVHTFRSHKDTIVFYFTYYILRLESIHILCILSHILLAQWKIFGLDKTNTQNRGAILFAWAKILCVGEKDIPWLNPHFSSKSEICYKSEKEICTALLCELFLLNSFMHSFTKNNIK